MRWCNYCGQRAEDTEMARTLEVRSPINGHGFALLDIMGTQPTLHYRCRDNIVKVLVERSKEG